MKSDIKQKWVEALESGDYQQGQECLKNQGQFCCLGVLCDIYAKEKGLEWKNINDHEYILTTPINDRYYDGIPQHPVTTELPKEVVLWAGLDSEDPTLSERYRDEYGDLGPLGCISANDDLQLSFIEIAALIKAWPEEGV